jgi:RimJ/RimL family protein N-acetyltransferase
MEWSAERILDSRSLFERRGVGIWLVNHKATEELIGFCGFLEITAVHLEPQLVYAMFQKFTGNGYATEMGRMAVAEARRHGFATIVASVDEVNVASVRVLEKLGFERIEMMQGAFGNMLLLRLAGAT